MPTYLWPGVYVEEKEGVPPIAGVGTSTAAFIGAVADDVTMPDQPDGTGPYRVREPNRPRLVTNWAQFQTSFGDFQDGNRTLAHAVFGFLNNGGTACYVTRLEGDSPDDVTALGGALAAIARVDEVAIVAAPGALSEAAQGALIDHCELLGDRFAILDGQQTEEISVQAIKGDLERNSTYAAMYFPWIRVYDPQLKQAVVVPPSGHVAGVYANVDGRRGVHKAPANEIVRGALDVTYRLTDAEQGQLNPKGINAIRVRPSGIKIWGARTLGGEDNGEMTYLNVRRLVNYVKESIDEGTQFAVFEPNSHPLWQQIKRASTAFLLRVWRDGALFGVEQAQAFYVKCDEETNPPEVRNAGQVVTEIGIAPVRPAEFVIFRIQQMSEAPA
jgi:uncharacterized protein